MIVKLYKLSCSNTLQHVYPCFSTIRTRWEGAAVYVSVCQCVSWLLCKCVRGSSLLWSQGTDWVSECCSPLPPLLCTASPPSPGSSSTPAPCSSRHRAGHGRGFLSNWRRRKLFPVVFVSMFASLSVHADHSFNAEIKHKPHSWSSSWRQRLVSLL